MISDDLRKVMQVSCFSSCPVFNLQTSLAYVISRITTTVLTWIEISLEFLAVYGYNAFAHPIPENNNHKTLL
jgi:hypothetical protein